MTNRERLNRLLLLFVLRLNGQADEERFTDRMLAELDRSAATPASSSPSPTAPASRACEVRG
jgi:hypothetical protein